MVRMRTKTTFFGRNMSLDQNLDVFTWTYSKMPCFDLAITMHYKRERRLVKYAPRRMHLDLTTKVEAKVDKPVKVDLIREA